MGKPTNVVIIHGVYASPKDNWFPWLEREVLLLGGKVQVPDFPTPQGHDLHTWRDSFVRQVGQVQPSMILIGHSLGAAFVLDLLENAKNSVLATILVCGFTGNLGLEDLDLLNESFTCREFNWRKIQQNAGQIHVINSDNDPYVPLAKGQELALWLKVPLTILPEAGHVNTASGHTSFPLLLEIIVPFLKSANPAGAFLTP